MKRILTIAIAAASAPCLYANFVIAQNALDQIPAIPKEPGTPPANIEKPKMAQAPVELKCMLSEDYTYNFRAREIMVATLTEDFIVDGIVIAKKGEMVCGEPVSGNWEFVSIRDKHGYTAPMPAMTKPMDGKGLWPDPRKKEEKAGAEFILHLIGSNLTWKPFLLKNHPQNSQANEKN